MSLSSAASLEWNTRRRIAVRLLPFLWFLYMIAFLDRVNVAYAALEMSHDLRFSDQVFGLGAGIFFVGYVLLEIPGALIVEHWSARLWIARIMITWGIITVLVGFVHTARQFYVIRFLLGQLKQASFRAFWSTSPTGFAGAILRKLSLRLWRLCRWRTF
jgi:sugar phosphate permease